MKNQKIYEEKLAQSSQTRFDINEFHSPIFRNLTKIFKFATKEPPKKFKLISNMIYYQGGYPRSNSLAKITELLNTFITTYYYFSILGHEKQIEKRLKDFGITITIDKEKLKDYPYSIEPKKYKQFYKAWKFVFGDEEAPKTVNKLLHLLLDKALEEQKTICQMSDSIKIDDAELVEKECEVKKSTYVKAVGLSYKQLKNKPVDKDLKKIEENIVSLEEGVLNQFK